MPLRSAIRALARTPGFSLVVVLTLGIGIGATTAMLSVVNGVLFKPLRFPEPERLYLAQSYIYSTETGRSDHFPVNARHFSEWRAHCQSCDGVALVGAQGFTLTGAGSPERLPGIEVSSNFFRTLRVAPQIGRDFATSEEGPANFHVVILSDALWRSHFAADPSIIGRSLTLNGEPHTVVGVMPPTLTLPRGTEWGPFFGHNRVPLLFRPVSLDFPVARPWSQFNYAVLVRTRPGASPRQAESEMTAAIKDFAVGQGVSIAASIRPMAEQMTGATRESLLLLAGAVIAVLALVSINIGGLILVRSVARSRDSSIRLALGAAPMDLIRPMLAEVLVLTTAGAALGVLLANGALKAFVAAAPLNLPRVDEIRPDWSMLAVALVAAIAAALMASLVPVWRLTRVELRQPLTSATRGSTDTRGRLRTLDAMMIAEVALSTAVLIVGGLLAASFLNVMRANRGFQTEHVVTQPLQLTAPTYQTTAARTQLIDRALATFRAIPGVSAVGVTSQLPLRGETWVDALVDADHPGDERNAPTANRRFISPQYIAALGVPIISGRDIEETDRSRSVALVSEKAAQLLWPNTNPIGRHIFRTDLQRRREDSEDPGKAEVIGVVADVRSTGLEQDPAPIVYEPYWQIGPGGPAFVFRSEREPASLAPDIRAAIGGLDPELPVAPPQSMQAIVSESAAVRRLQTTLVAAFAVAALAVAALGLYGLVAFSVARRTRELGLRVALGATSGSIFTLVIRQGLRPVAIGGAAGILGALFAGDLLANQLYGVSAQDPRVLAIVALTLLTVTIAACWIPARRATAVDPMIPLRAE